MERGREVIWILLKSQTTSAKSIRPLPLQSNAVTGLFAAIQGSGF